uniref:DUF6535 domain-containing protein n=1 Tax=Moniliophthora roreri TaxID=221103 RepID=A0A0W0FXW5_MONRR
MSSGDPVGSHSLSRRGGVAGTSEKQECMDPTQISLPPSETGSVPENAVQENEVRDTVISLNAGTEADLDLQPLNNPEAAPPPARMSEEFWKAMEAENFLRKVAAHDPYIPNPYLMRTENVDEEKKPTKTESWERMLKEVSRHDEDMVKGWRDDIDTLLVFAGLFSAVVTAFAIESYQWLAEDPADTTIALLTQLISVQVNGSQSISSGPAQFKADVSSIRINVFWFLSLILSLASALFGLLCKQWVREYQRDTTTRTPGEALALRQLRRDSFEKWGVSSFLSALPILLEVALLFFFVGVLDLLWNRHRVPFAVCFVAISFSAGLYFLTALLPTLMVPRDQTDDIKHRRFNRLSYQFICPYKSPQAWLVYRFSSAILRPLLKIPAINDFLREKARRFWDHIKSPASDWSSFDLWVVRQFDRHVYLPGFVGTFDLKVYELCAFEWAVAMFRDSPSMTPHLQNVLGMIPPSVVSSAVLGRWDRTMWKAVSMRDVEGVLRYAGPGASPNPTIPLPILQHSEGISLLFHHQYWVKMATHRFLDDYNLGQLIGSMKHADLQHSTGLRFVIPFPIVDALWTHGNPTIRAESLTLLSLFEESWKSCLGYVEERHDGERRAFMRALADHINRTDRVSELLTSKRGQAFIRFIHNEAITRGLVDRHPFKHLGNIWSRAIKRAQEVGYLPSDYVAPIPGHRDGPPTLPNLNPVRYSIETERGVRADNHEVLHIVTSSDHGDATGVGPLKEGHVHRPQNSSPHSVNTIDTPSLGSRVTGSPGNTIRDHESGVDSMERPTDSQEDHTANHNSSYMGMDNAQRHEKGDNIKDLGPGKRRDGILGDSSKHGDDTGDVGADSYSLRSLERRAFSIQNNQERAELEISVLHHEPE